MQSPYRSLPGFSGWGKPGPKRAGLRAFGYGGGVPVRDPVGRQQNSVNCHDPPASFEKTKASDGTGFRFPSQSWSLLMKKNPDRDEKMNP
jgi:hypothetical protein